MIIWKSVAFSLNSLYTAKKGTSWTPSNALQLWPDLSIGN